MEKNTITKIVCNNVYQLCLENDVKIGDLENNLGCGTGFFSRIKSNKSTVCISIDKCYQICQIFNIDIHILLDQHYFVNAELKRLENEKLEMEKKINTLKEQLSINMETI